MSKSCFMACILLLSLMLVIHSSLAHCKRCVDVTVLSAKSDSDFMFCLQRYQGLTIDRLLVYYRINKQVVYR